MPVPNLLAYDPAFAFEIAVIIDEGIRRMYKEGESIFYYITVMNEPYVMPHMPGDVKDGILKGLYKYKPAANKKAKLRAQLLGSGAILNEVLQAQEILEKNYGVAADVWSVTSYKGLYTDGIETERWNRLHPDETPRVPYVKQCLGEEQGAFVAASGYLKTLPGMISQWLPRPKGVLRTDGFGRSEGRSSVREFFEVDSRFVVLAALHELGQEGLVGEAAVQNAIKDLGINPEKPNPVIS